MRIENQLSEVLLSCGVHCRSIVVQLELRELSPPLKCRIYDIVWDSWEQLEKTIFKEKWAKSYLSTSTDNGHWHLPWCRNMFDEVACLEKWRFTTKNAIWKKTCKTVLFCRMLQQSWNADIYSHTLSSVMVSWHVWWGCVFEKMTFYAFTMKNTISKKTCKNILFCIKFQQ